MLFVVEYFGLVGMILTSKLSKVKKKMFGVLFWKERKIFTFFRPNNTFKSKVKKI